MSTAMSNTPWDDVTKALIRNNPQAFINLVAPGGTFVAAYSEKLLTVKLEGDSFV